MKRLAKYSDQVYALLRIVSGLLFSFHGAGKVFGLLADRQPAVGSQIWIGGIIELVGGLAILLGFQTRVAAFICSGMMAVAYTQFHWKFQFGAKFWPIVNQGEMAVLYCFLFLYLATRGGVTWCVDKAS